MLTSTVKKTKTVLDRGVQFTDVFYAGSAADRMGKVEGIIARTFDLFILARYSLHRNAVTAWFFICKEIAPNTQVCDPNSP